MIIQGFVFKSNKKNLDREEHLKLEFVEKRLNVVNDI
jgi:hypothetical protein